MSTLQSTTGYFCGFSSKELGGIIYFPIPPEKLTQKINNQNKTATLLNGDEINLVKKKGLTEYTFELLLPNVIYPFALYEDGRFRNASYYIDILEQLKTDKSVFNFRLDRIHPNGRDFGSTIKKVTLESYSVVDNAKDGFDMRVSITLKEWVEYGTVKVGKLKTKTKKKRKSTKTTTTSKAKKYTVVAGDCLWGIAQRFYGDGSKYTNIVNANKGIFANRSPNLIYAGEVLTIPALQ